MRELDVSQLTDNTCCSTSSALFEDVMDFRLRTLTLAAAIGALGLASVVTPGHPREKGVHGRHAANANKNRQRRSKP
jgi:hypothetical protein